jgi:phosphatidylglycerol:prolipoprotein diacylglycerol transferase
MPVQGFVLGAIGTLALGALLLIRNVARVLDVTAPGLLFGMTVGRLGCLLGGCCAGRPTSSRLGVRSSDRRLFARRLPVQLFEGAVAAAAGLAGLLLITVGRDEPARAVFVGALAAYTLGRQLLFPLRDLPAPPGAAPGP